MRVYYNEWDPFCAAWLRNLMQAGLIPHGDVDERSITEVQPDDLRGYDQAHFFAGIGGWAYALQLAQWTPKQKVWTGSCPCQPFSVAGKQHGENDARHVWPEWRRLIRQCRPPILFGEQVASPLGRSWLAVVRTDLEALGYGVGCADLCAASVGAPHIRQRLCFMAHTQHSKRGTEFQEHENPHRGHGSRGGGHASVMGDTNDTGSQRRNQRRHGANQRPSRPASVAHQLADAGRQGRQQVRSITSRSGKGGRAPRLEQRPEHGGALHTPWKKTDWLPCRDGKMRPVEPGTFPLAHGIPNRVGRLRGYGNAIVPSVAAAFIEAYLSCQESVTP